MTAVCWSPRTEHELLTGDASGQVRLWDIRRAGCRLVLDQHYTRRLAAGGGGRGGRCRLAAGRTWPLAARGCWPHAAAGCTWPLAARGCWPHVAAGCAWLLAARGCWLHVAAGCAWPLAARGCWLRVAACGSGVVWLAGPVVMAWVGVARAAGGDGPQQPQAVNVGDNRRLYAHDGAITALAATPDALHYLSAGADSRVRLWDSWTHRHQLLHYPGTVHRGSRGKRLAISADGRYFFHPAALSIQVFETLSGRLVRELRHGHFQPITACCCNHLLGEMYSAALDGTIVAWSSVDRAPSGDEQSHGLGADPLGWRGGGGPHNAAAADGDAWSEESL